LAPNRRKTETRKEFAAETLQDRREQHSETGENHEVQDAGIAEFQQPPVQSDIGDKSAEAITDAIPALV